MALSDFRGKALKFTPQGRNPNACFMCGKLDGEHRPDRVCFPERAPIYEGRVLAAHPVPEDIEGDPEVVVWDDEQERIVVVRHFYYHDLDNPSVVDATPEVRKLALAYIGVT